MPVDYYSDRVRGTRQRREEEITEPVWGGIVALVERGIAHPWFGEEFPLMCEDGKGAYGCDGRAVGLAIAAEIPELGWPLSEGELPPTLAALDLLQFMFEHASLPSQLDYHRFFNHHHLEFNSVLGRQEMGERINRLLARGGMAYQLDEEGQIQHLASPALEAQLRRELPETSDSKFDDLLETAISKFRDRDPQIRRESLEPLWDAFERMKTILEQDKQRGAKKLIAAATAGTAPEEEELLTSEMKELRRIGNRFRIRHHETDKAEVSDALAEQLFGRMYSLIYRVHPALR